jgi:hypothetical protein
MFKRWSMLVSATVVLATVLTGIVIVPNVVAAQSRLPQCPADTNVFTWTNCQGTYSYASGDKYVGEFKGGKRNGQGTYTFGPGQWSGDKYVGEFKDEKRTDKAPTRRLTVTNTSVNLKKA